MPYMNNSCVLSRLISTTAICVAFASSNASGADRSNEVQYTKAYEECVESANGVTITLRKCANDELQRQDMRLNRLYKKLLGATEPSGREKLKAAQLAWIQFRDRQCEYEASSEQQGSMWPLLITGCHMDFTIRRANEIEGWIYQR
jgi:uncharacterized protein YecT (DUF1311 family)